MSTKHIDPSVRSQSGSSAREIFLKVEEPIQELIRQVLTEERHVQHLKKKTDIHVKIYEHIRRLIK
jgi:hypothetical protein